MILLLVCHVQSITQANPVPGGKFLVLTGEAMRTMLHDTTRFRWVAVNTDSIDFYRSHFIAIERAGCKNAVAYALMPKPTMDASVDFIEPSKKNNSLPPVLPGPAPVSFKVHGDLTYDMNYRSHMDTPYAATNFMQHHIGINIYAKWMGLPVVFQINTRQSNVPFLKNYTSVGILYDQNHFRNKLAEDLERRYLQLLNAQRPDSQLYRSLQREVNKQQVLRRWLEDGRQLQRFINSKQFISSLPLKSLPSTVPTKYNAVPDADSAALHDMAVEKEKAEAFIHEYRQKEETYHKITDSITGLQKEYKKAVTWYQQKIDSCKKALYDLNNNKTLLPLLKQDAAYKNQYGWYRFLLSVKKAAIGRSSIDYSPLTVRNISINGLNVEYYDKVYVAVAAGSLDYNYRDFMMQPAGAPRQYLLTARVGIGNPEGHNSIVLTAYTGSKQASYFINNNAVTQTVSGVSVSARYYFDQQTYLVGEIAKSAYPAYIPGDSARHAGRRTISLSDHSNEAYSLQLFSYIIPTGTRLYAQYQQMGSNFQSFSTYNYNSNTVSWQVRADQYFFDRKLYLTGSLKKNDYNSPFQVANYQSNYIFKSLQATLRIHHWPSLSLGYLPSSQFTHINGQVQEYRFNTLTASSNYIVPFQKGYAGATLVYTRFYNRSTDTGFVFYNASSVYLNTYAAYKQLRLSNSYSNVVNSHYQLQTIEEGLQWQIRKNFSCGGGLKWNRLNSGGQDKLGCFANFRLSIPALGQFTASYDRGALPGLNGQLVTSDYGSVTYYRTF